MRSADAGSDHHLVVPVIKMKLSALRSQVPQGRNIAQAGLKTKL